MISFDEESTSAQVFNLSVHGMMCQNNCGSTVTKALLAVSGVESAKVSFATSSAEVVTGQTVTAQQLIDAIEEVGFDAEEKCDVIELAVEGMMCQNNCGTTVHNAISNLPGVLSTTVSFKNKSAIVKVPKSGSPKATVAEIIAAIELIGFEASENTKSLPNLRTFSLTVTGMMCQNNCGSTVTKALLGVSGVESAKVTFETSSAEVTAASNVTVDELVNAVEEVGFDAEEAGDIIEISVEGMMCQNNCGTTVYNAITSLEGVNAASVSFASKSATVKVPKSSSGTKRASIEEIIQAIEAVGFYASPVETKTVKKVTIIDPTPKSQKVAPKTERPEVVIDIPLDVGDGLEQAELGIKGMSCAACVGNVEGHANKLPGLIEIKVALVAEKASIKFDPDVITAEEIAKEITSLGYKATVNDMAGGCVLELHISNLRSEYDFDELKSLLAREYPTVSLQPLHQTEPSQAPQSYKEVAVQYDPHLVGCRVLLAFLEEEGYFVTLTDRNAKSADTDDAALEYRRAFWGALAFTLPMVLISWGGRFIPGVNGLSNVELLGKEGLNAEELLFWSFSTVVQFKYGKKFYINAYNAVSHGAANMDVLIVLGTTSAYLYSFISLVFGIFTSLNSTTVGELTRAEKRDIEISEEDTHFFETAAMLITFVLLGKMLESSARKRTAGAISALMDLQAPSALLWTSNENTDTADSENFNTDASPTIREIDLRLVQLDDILQVLPGAQIPVDGIVVSGSSKVDESMLTGESMPVKKKADDKVIGGTVNKHGTLLFRATHIGADTALSRIVKLVEDAQTSKAPIQAIADRISASFVPIVVTLALLTWLFWGVAVFALDYSADDLIMNSQREKLVFCFKFGVAVLVISCPCALGLATPTAVMVATGVGARIGILVKGGEALEMGQNVSTVVFDKTGTITTGTPSVVDHVVLRGSEGKFFSLVASAEQSSEHPLAKAITSFAKAQMAKTQASSLSDKIKGVRLFNEVTGLKAKPGRGIEAIVDGTLVRVGNPRFLNESGINMDEPAAKKLTNEDGWKESREKEGCSVVLVAFNNHLAGAVAIRDKVKPSSADAVEHLRCRGIDVWMITGDGAVTAAAIAAEVNIPESRIISNVLPEDKSAKVIELQNQGEIVAMVGDGINDSPALTAADLGIAIGTGTDVAVECADVVLIKNDLVDVVRVIELSVATLARIRANLWFSFGYNMIGIPVAAGLLYPAFGIRLPPPVAGLLMALSSVSVVLSSLYLNFHDSERSLRKPSKLGKSRPKGTCSFSMCELSPERNISNSKNKYQRIGEGPSEASYRSNAFTICGCDLKMLCGAFVIGCFFAGVLSMFRISPTGLLPWQQALESEDKAIASIRFKDSFSLSQENSLEIDIVPLKSEFQLCENSITRHSVTVGGLKVDVFSPELGVSHQFTLDTIQDGEDDFKVALGLGLNAAILTSIEDSLASNTNEVLQGIELVVVLDWRREIIVDDPAAIVSQYPACPEVETNDANNVASHEGSYFVHGTATVVIAVEVDDVAIEEGLQFIESLTKAGTVVDASVWDGSV